MRFYEESLVHALDSSTADRVNVATASAALTFWVAPKDLRAARRLFNSVKVSSDSFRFEILGLRGLLLTPAVTDDDEDRAGGQGEGRGFERGPDADPAVDRVKMQVDLGDVPTW